jgi:uncharacterized protein YdiU (UPF0061 family)
VKDIHQPTMPQITFTNQYTGLGDNFYQSITPTRVKKPGLIAFNHALLAELGLPPFDESETNLAAIFSGNDLLDGMEPIAMAYAGHQFGNFVPQLGDGRAILLGQVTDNNNRLLDIQLKGSGQTAFSRNGDGRAALGPVLREYIVSEAMAKLGLPTTRALAAVTTGEQVYRENMLPGGVITRVAESFIRVGTFEYFSCRSDIDSVRKLADYVIQHYYPELQDTDNNYLALLRAVSRRQAKLIAQWMQIGFIHGVMNTDNMSVTGQTIDYGPCAFMDDYSHTQVFSSIDRQGRYSYSNQPKIGLWNLSRFAETLLPLFDDNTDKAVEHAKENLEIYISEYQQAWLDGMRRKLGMQQSMDDDKSLADDLLELMHNQHADFTLVFYHLSRLSLSDTGGEKELRDLFNSDENLDSWLTRWRNRLRQENSNDDKRQSLMQQTNPVYIPRNHQIEAAIRAAEDNNDFSVFHALHEVLQSPFESQPGKENYMQSPQPHEIIQQTFCGT